MSKEYYIVIGMQNHDNYRYIVSDIFESKEKAEKRKANMPNSILYVRYIAGET